ncbi:hypothetical protein GQX74_015007 [Glossina fuscipes]|nr:hypothetical protein GQX74_015007 [Glossina fuscipes]
MAANFCKRFLAAKSLIEVNRNLKNVQPRLRRRILTDRDINSMRDETPPLKKGSHRLLKN